MEEKKKNKFKSIKRRKKIHIWTKKERNQWPRGLFLLNYYYICCFFLPKFILLLFFIT
jgi:hypothetical protein